MVKAKKYVVKKYFEGLPKRDDFQIEEYQLPRLEDGDILLQTEWVSVDPYLRAHNSKEQVPYEQFGFQVGIVQESRSVEFPVGTRVVTHNGWVTHSIATTKPPAHPSLRVYELPDLQGLPDSLGVGAVGMPGATAYFGFLELCKPKPRETVVVTGAAGAVGSIVGQIAKIKGCKVIGFVGSDDKVKWLEGELGFDRAFNYKTVDVATVLKEAAPDGVDCYFDNVGGEISSTIISQMNTFGRVSVCGSISAYNADPEKMPKATILQPSIVSKQLRIEGFVVWRWAHRWDEAMRTLASWIRNGQLKPREHVTEGFDNIYDAFVGMLQGENTGKAVVKIS